MRIIAMSGICDREVGEWIDANVVTAKILELGRGTVMVDREGALGQ
jgi:hypothetical protein